MVLAVPIQLTPREPLGLQIASSVHVRAPLLPLLHPQLPDLNLSPPSPIYIILYVFFCISFIIPSASASASSSPSISPSLSQSSSSSTSSPISPSSPLALHHQSRHLCPNLHHPQYRNSLRPQPLSIEGVVLVLEVPFAINFSLGFLFIHPFSTSSRSPSWNYAGVPPTQVRSSLFIPLPFLTVSFTLFFSDPVVK